MSAPDRSAGTPQCSNADIKVGDEGGQGAGGHIAFFLTFTNVGAGSCYLQGYPGAALADESGKVINATRTLKGFIGWPVATDGGSKPLGAPPHVVLTPGREVIAVLEWSDVDPIEGVPNGCLMQTGTELSVTAPNATSTTELAGLSYVCDGFEVGPVLDEAPPPMH